MKWNIELEIDLGDFIDPSCPEEREWFFNHIMTKSNLFLHDNEIGDQIGQVTRVKRCEPTEQSEPRYTLDDIERCVENWGLCKVEKPYIKSFLESKN